MPKPLNFSYGSDSDILTIEGMRYSGDLFRAFAHGGLRLNTPFEIIKRKDGVVMISEVVWTHHCDITLIEHVEDDYPSPLG